MVGPGWQFRCIAAPRNQNFDIQGLAECFQEALVYLGAEFPRIVLLLDKGIGDLNAPNLLPILKVFTVKNVALTFDRRSNN